MTSFKRNLAIFLTACMVVMLAAPAYAANGSEPQTAGAGIEPTALTAAGSSADLATPSNAAEESEHEDATDEGIEFTDSDIYAVRFRDKDTGRAYDMLPWESDSVMASELCHLLVLGNDVSGAESLDPDLITVTPVGGTDDKPENWGISINLDSPLTEGQMLLQTGNSKTHWIHVSKITFPTKTVSYLNEAGEPAEQDCIVVSGKITYFWLSPGQWYSFANNAEVNERIINFGTEDDPAHIILADGCRASANAGIDNFDGSALVIYGGKKGSGQLTADGRGEGAGIGGSFRNLSAGLFTIYGGTLRATGSSYSAAIGGAKNYGDEEGGPGGTIIINGGTVTANGGKGAAGIGTSEDVPSLGTITLSENLGLLAGSTGTALEKKSLEQYLESRDRYVKIASKYKEQSDSDETDDSGSIQLSAGTADNPVNGTWTQDANGTWHFAAADSYRNTWGYIVNPYAQGGQHAADWFYFDANGNMLTGWQYINGKWYYLNPSKDGTLGACLIGPGRTPDGYEIDAAGAWTGR